MPPKGRPRLTDDDLAARVRAYSVRYDVRAGAGSLPPFPSGKRESEQHREWLALYKLSSRLARRARGQCERCPEPAVADTVFCERHRGSAEDRPAGAGAPGSIDQRRELLERQDGRCPVCFRPVHPESSVADARPGRADAAFLHAACQRLAAQAEAAGVETFDRLRKYLWPSRTRRK